MAAHNKNPLLWPHTQHAQAAPNNALGELLVDAVRSGVEVRVRDALVKGADVNYKVVRAALVACARAASCASRDALRDGPSGTAIRRFS